MYLARLGYEADAAKHFLSCCMLLHQHGFPPNTHTHVSGSFEARGFDIGSTDAIKASCTTHIQNCFPVVGLQYIDTSNHSLTELFDISIHPSERTHVAWRNLGGLLTTSLTMTAISTDELWSSNLFVLLATKFASSTCGFFIRNYLNCWREKTVRMKVMQL